MSLSINIFGAESRIFTFFLYRILDYDDSALFKDAKTVRLNMTRLPL